MRHLRLFLLAVLAVALAVVPGFATTYSVRGDWNDAVTGAQNVDFSSMSGFNTSLTGGTAPNQVTFTRIGDQGWAYIGNGYGPAGTGNYLEHYDYSTGRRGFVVTPALSDVTAFGVDLWTLDEQSRDIEIRIYSVGDPIPTTHTVTTLPISQAAAFFGYTSNTAVQYVEFSTNGSRSGVSSVGIVVLDNYSFGQMGAGAPDPPPSGETPEAATLGYVGMGIIALVMGSRRRHC